MDGALSNRTYLLVLFADILLSWPLLSCTSWFPVWYQEALNPLPLCAPRTFACVCMLQDLSLSPVQSRRMTLNAAGKCVEKKKDSYSNWHTRTAMSSPFIFQLTQPSEPPHFAPYMDAVVLIHLHTLGSVGQECWTVWGFSWSWASNFPLSLSGFGLFWSAFTDLWIYLCTISDFQMSTSYSRSPFALLRAVQKSCKRLIGHFCTDRVLVSIQEWRRMNHCII